MFDVYAVATTVYFICSGSRIRAIRFRARNIYCVMIIVINLWHLLDFVLRATDTTAHDATNGRDDRRSISK